MHGADGVDEGIRQVGDPAEGDQMATSWHSDHNQIIIRRHVTVSQYELSGPTMRGSSPVSNLEPARLATIAPSDGCDVSPDMASIATSTMSAPASAAANMDATPAPAVS